MAKPTAASSRKRPCSRSSSGAANTKAFARRRLDALLRDLRRWGRSEIEAGNNFTVETSIVERYETVHSALFANGVAAHYNPHGPGKMVLTFAGFPYANPRRVRRAGRRRRRPAPRRD